VTQEDQYVGAMADLADVDRDLLVLNSRRIAWDAGWNASNPENLVAWMPDGAHYSLDGARFLARNELNTLFSRLLPVRSIPEPTGWITSLTSVLMFASSVRRRASRSAIASERSEESGARSQRLTKSTEIGRHRWVTHSPSTPES
jgi:hypothetical protein